MTGRALSLAVEGWGISKDHTEGSLTPKYCQDFFDAITMGKNRKALELYFNVFPVAQLVDCCVNSVKSCVQLKGTL